MFNMEEIMTNYIGDWVYNTKKLDGLTKERALSDIRAMNESADYSASDIDEAIKLAGRKLDIGYADLLFEAVLDASQVS